MKKPINLLLALQTLLLIGLASVMFSSCIIVHPDDEDEIFIETREKDKKVTKVKSDDKENEKEAEVDPATEKFTITVKNETSMVVVNWFVKNDNIITLSKTGFTGSIQAHGEDMIFDLPKGYYKIYFTFAGDCQNNYQSDTIYLDKDVTYCLLEGPTPYISECRSADAVK